MLKHSPAIWGCGFVLGFMLAGGGSPATAGTIVYLSNFTNAQGSTLFMSPTRRVLAQKFLTGANPDGYLLDEVMLRVGFDISSGGGDITVSLCQGGVTSPGAAIATFTGPSPTNNTLTNMTYAAPGGTILDPATLYWIAVGCTGTGDYFMRFAGGGYLQPNGQDGWAYLMNSNFNGGGANNTNAFYMEARVSDGIQYVQDFATPAVGATSMGDGSQLTSSHLGSLAEVVDATFKSLQLTDTSAVTRTAFRLPDLNPGDAVNAFSAKWSAEINGDFPDGGEGFSVTFGPIGSLSLTSTVYAQESGFDVGLTLSVRTGPTNPGIYLLRDGVVIASSNFTSATKWGVSSTNFHIFEWDWHYSDGMSLRLNRRTIFTNVNTFGFVPASGNRLAWAARTSTNAERIRIDNIMVATEGNLASQTIGTPYVASAGSLETGDAFDGNATNVNNAWSDYSPPDGYIGGTLSTQYRIAAYGMVAGGSTRNADPEIWTFEGNSDGSTNFIELSTTTTDVFRTYGDVRFLETTNAELMDVVLLHVHTNGGHAGVMHLAELMAYRFIPADSPAEWEQTDAPTNTYNWHGVAQSADGSQLIACSYGGIYKSTNDPLTWSLIPGTTNGEPGYQAVASSGEGDRLAVVSDVILSGTGDVHISSNYGSSFAGTTAPSLNWEDVAMSVDGLTVIACAREFAQTLLRVSYDGGNTWTSRTPDKRWASVDVSSEGDKLVAAADDVTNTVGVGQIWLSTNSGASFFATTAPSQEWTEVAMSGDGRKLFATAVDDAQSTGWIYMSTNGGTTWTQADVDAEPYVAIDCSVDGVVVVAAADFSGGAIRISQDSGRTWSNLDAPVGSWNDVALDASGSQIAIAGDDGVWVRTLDFLPPSVADRPGFYYAYGSKADTYAYVNPNGLPTMGWTVFGTNLNGGARTNFHNMGSGTGDVSMLSTFSNLVPNTIYYYRHFATNKTGVLRYGNILILDTPEVSSAEVDLTFNGSQFICSATASVLTTYYLQRSTSLLNGAWINVNTTDSGNFGAFQFNIVPNPSGGYFRIISPSN